MLRQPYLACTLYYYSSKLEKSEFDYILLYHNYLISQRMNIKPKFCILSFILMFCFLSTTSIKAQKLYKTSWDKEVAIYGTSVGLFMNGLYIEGIKDPITESTLSLLKSSTLSGIDQGTVSQFSNKASTQSDYLKDGIFLVPFSLLLSKQGRENANELLVMYTEVLAFNGSATFFSKNAMGRYRPYTYNPNVPLDLKLTNTSRKSFFSGHTSHVASLSFFTAKVFNDLYPESDFRYLVWGGAVVTPAITAYLRVKAGRHFPTDVIVGYGVGALIGYFIPHFHKVTKESNIKIIGAEGGIGMVYTF